MAKLDIQTGENNPILRKRSEEVARVGGGGAMDGGGNRVGAGFGSEFKKFAKDMRKVMLEKDGLGLAAPQVGVNKRLIIVTLNYGTPNAVMMSMVNPEILEFGVEMEVAEEGCLSLPGVYKKVERARDIKVRFCDLDGGEQVFELCGLNARVVQHEVDHLDGVLFVDRAKEKNVVEA